MLKQQNGLTSGNDIRGLVRTHNANQSFISNWDGIDLSDTKYLLDKSIVNPIKYDYHVLNWQNYQHKMIYMIRDIYKVLKSQFLIVLAGEESYQYQIDKFGKIWDTTNITEELIRDIIDHNKQKYTHLFNLTQLPKDVFDKDKNIFFCTFEDFVADFDKQKNRLSEFIRVDIISDGMPHMNDTLSWYGDDLDLYNRNLAIFEEWKDCLFDYCIDYNEWVRLSEYINIDLVSKYGIKP